MKNNDGNLIFEHKPHIASYASVVGKKEGEGPLRMYFDRIIYDSYAGKDTFEQAESELMNTAVRVALNKGDYSQQDIDLACCGDQRRQGRRVLRSEVQEFHKAEAAAAVDVFEKAFDEQEKLRRNISDSRSPRVLYGQHNRHDIRR